MLSAKMLNFNNLIVGAYEEVVLYMLFVPCFVWNVSVDAPVRGTMLKKLYLCRMFLPISRCLCLLGFGAMIEQISRINEGERVSCSLVE